jgi:hypothetical protein
VCLRSSGCNVKLQQQLQAPQPLLTAGSATVTTDNAAAAGAGNGYSTRSIKLTLGPRPSQQQLQRQEQALAAAGQPADAPVYLDPVVLRDVLLGAVGFVESVAEQRARQMRPAQLQETDASVQVCGCAPVNRLVGWVLCALGLLCRGMCGWVLLGLWSQ